MAPLFVPGIYVIPTSRRGNPGTSSGWPADVCTLNLSFVSFLAYSFVSLIVNDPFLIVAGVILGCIFGFIALVVLVAVICHNRNRIANCWNKCLASASRHLASK